MGGALVVFAKAPRPGRVKTRMVPPLSPDQACDLYACMLDDVLETSAAACRELGLLPVLAVHPAEAVSELAQRAPGFRAVTQRGADLAARMAEAVVALAEEGFSPVLLRGSDSPALAPSLIARAVGALREADLVIAPDADGGYSLVGLRRPVPGVFDHPMSTSHVARDTLARAGERGLATRLLEPCFDLDTAVDLGRLAAVRAVAAPLCPRTLAFLDRSDLWPEVRGNDH